MNILTIFMNAISFIPIFVSSPNQTKKETHRSSLFSFVPQVLWVILCVWGFGVDVQGTGVLGLGFSFLGIMFSIFILVKR